MPESKCTTRPKYGCAKDQQTILTGTMKCFSLNATVCDVICTIPYTDFLGYLVKTRNVLRNSIDFASRPMGTSNVPVYIN